MITNAQLLPVTVEMILKHQHPFYLTGSRFFGGVTDISDWDFFALYSEELRSQLLDYGFEPNDSEAYSIDTEIIEVLSKNCIDPMFPEECSCSPFPSTLLPDSFSCCHVPCRFFQALLVLLSSKHSNPLLMF